MLTVSTSQNVLYGSSDPSLDSAPILRCPSDVLVLIGRLLTNRDARNFTIVCAQLLNLRFADNGFGIFNSQLWKRVPRSDEAISSKMIFSTGEEGRNLRSIVPGLSALTLDFRTELTPDEISSIRKRLKQLNKLTALCVHCVRFASNELRVFVQEVLNRTKVDRMDCLPFFNLTLAHLVDGSAQDYFVNFDRELAGYLKGLTLYSSRLSFIPAELGQFSGLQRLEVHATQVTALPTELGQLSNLQHLELDLPKLTSLPLTLCQLECLQSLKIESYALASLPDQLGQLTNLQTLILGVGEGITSLPSQLGQLCKLRTLNITGHSLSLPDSLGQLSRLQILSLHTKVLVPFLEEIMQWLENVPTVDIYPDPRKIPAAMR